MRRVTLGDLGKGLLTCRGFYLVEQDVGHSGCTGRVERVSCLEGVFASFVTRGT